jgi:hypothetical protein
MDKNLDKLQSKTTVPYAKGGQKAKIVKNIWEWGEV